MHVCGCGIVIPVNCIKVYAKILIAESNEKKQLIAIPLIATWHFIWQNAQSNKMMRIPIQQSKQALEFNLTRHRICVRKMWNAKYKIENVLPNWKTNKKAENGKWKMENRKQKTKWAIHCRKTNVIYFKSLCNASSARAGRIATKTGMAYKYTQAA